jgi:L-ascorbate metabolism protein UlaG (beta-lactamase superfamily)
MIGRRIAFWPRLRTLALGAALAAASTVSAFASCLPIANAPGPRVTLAKLDLADLEPGQVGLTFLGHASFLIESPAGVTAVTDYSGAYVPEHVPDIVTMNHAHISHYTDTPDPEIKYVLRGWDPNGGKAEINLTYKDVHIRNVPTNIRDFAGGTIYNGNSIFIFEVGSLCIAHLGHIHHELLPTHLEAMGPIDVVLVPVDGAYTIDQPGMIKIMQTIGAPLAIPMHFFGPSTLARFIDIASKDYKIVMSESAHVVLSRATLPKEPTLLVLPGH